MPKEPQSYGSQADWVEGDTDEKVTPTGNHGPIEDVGGYVSDVQLAENIEPTGKATTENEQPVSRITDQHKGARRGGFFKRRDYRA